MHLPPTEVLYEMLKKRSDELTEATTISNPEQNHDFHLWLRARHTWCHDCERFVELADWLCKRCGGYDLTSMNDRGRREVERERV